VIGKIVNFIGDSKNAGTLKKIGYVALVITVIADFFAERHHALYIWDETPGWGAFYGFVSCVLIIIVSKFIGHQGGVMKKEDYYD
jgi:hypothetical protein